MLMAAVQKEYAIVYFTQSKIKNPILSFLIWNFAIESNDDDDDDDDDELFCGMVDRRKAFSLISSRDHCQRSSPS